MTRVRAALGLWLCLILFGTAALAEQVCLKPPYDSGSDEISAIAGRLVETLAPHASLARALSEGAPDLCIDDSLVQEQGYYEPKTNRIVLRSGLDPGFQLAILVHEVRHLEQFNKDVCPTVKVTLTDYIRSRLAMEADAAAIGIYVAWTLREEGQSGPWDSLALWPTHEDLVARFAKEMTANGDVVAATAATHSQWYLDTERREMYALAICSNYLDMLDLENLLPGKLKLSEEFADSLCRMPDGRLYGCIVPP